MRFSSLIDALSEALAQEAALLAEIPDELFRAPGQGRFKSSIGQHIRHNLDHFTAFFAGLEAGKIDYEQRERAARIAEMPACAGEAVARFRERLEGLRASEDHALLVREESEAGAEAPAWLSSSLGRELQFLLGHTVHHHALIAMIADAHAIPLPEGFGVAPSTRRHERAASATAG